MKHLVSLLFVPFLLLGSRGARAQNFDIKSLEDLVGSRPFNSLDDLISQLPESLRSKYSLIYKSRSPQPADLMAPRVVLYDGPSNLYLAFAGEAQAKHDFIEVIDFDSNARRFNFRVIEKSGESGRLVMKSGPEVNHSCVKCHNQDHDEEDMHPNWEEYASWAGVYGSEHNMPFSSLQPEIDMFEKFKSEKARTNRYQYLIGLQQKNIVDLSQDNLGLTNLIFSQNVSRITRKIVDVAKQHPDFLEAIKIAAKGFDMVKAILNKGPQLNFIDALPASAGDKGELKARLEQIRKDLTAEIESSQHEHLQRLSSFSPSHIQYSASMVSLGVRIPHGLAEFRLLFDDLLGISTKDWSPSFTTDGPQYNDGYYGALERLRTYGYDELKNLPSAPACQTLMNF